MKRDISESDFAGLEHTAEQKAAMEVWNNARFLPPESKEWSDLSEPPPFTLGDLVWGAVVVLVVIVGFALAIK